MEAVRWFALLGAVGLVAVTFEWIGRLRGRAQERERAKARSRGMVESSRQAIGEAERFRRCVADGVPYGGG